jgi:hypothetical protein
MASTVWPSPIPCSPENPLRGLRSCEAKRLGQLCSYVRESFCSIDLDRVGEALERFGLDEFATDLDDELEAEDVLELADRLRRALQNCSPEPRQHAEADFGLLQWLVGYLGRLSDLGCGLTHRFEEGYTRRDRY